MQPRLGQRPDFPSVAAAGPSHGLPLWRVADCEEKSEAAGPDPLGRGLLHSELYARWEAAIVDNLCLGLRSEEIWRVHETRYAHMQDRSPTAPERAVIERLLSVDFRDVEFFRAQVPAIRVRSMCSCGGGTLNFAVDPEAKRAPSQEWRDNAHLLVEGDSRSWLMPFQNEGWFSRLEHVPNGPSRQDLDAASIQPDLAVETTALTTPPANEAQEGRDPPRPSFLSPNLWCDHHCPFGLTGAVSPPLQLAS